jgi:peptidoglycan hydrolase-like protein with peptidoglycan-binding domain
MKKVILEEIENMKYLLGYKRGVVISEQDMDNDVNPKLTASAEQPAPTTAAPTTAAPATATPATAAPTTAAPATGTETPNPTIKMGVYNERVKYLQELLNYKFQSGLTPDGKYGPKTANAILKNIEVINQLKLKPVETVTTSQQVVQQPVQQITTNTNIPQQ